MVPKPSGKTEAGYGGAEKGCGNSKSVIITQKLSREC